MPCDRKESNLLEFTNNFVKFSLGDLTGSKYGKIGQLDTSWNYH